MERIKLLGERIVFFGITKRIAALRGDALPFQLGGSGDGGAAVAAGDDPDRAVVDGHAQSALALAVAQPMTVGGLRSMVLQS